MVYQGSKNKLAKYLKPIIEEFLLSYNGRFFDGGYGVFDKQGRNLFLSRLKNLNKQRESKNYKNIKFINCDFANCIVENAVIYLDPPYQNVKQYGKAFDHSRLWDYVRKMGEPGKGNIILLSELQNPNKNEWAEIWNQEYSYSLRDKNNRNKKVVEKLFMWIGKYD